MAPKKPIKQMTTKEKKDHDAANAATSRARLALNRSSFVAGLASDEAKKYVKTRIDEIRKNHVRKGTRAFQGRRTNPGAPSSVAKSAGSSTSLGAIAPAVARPLGKASGGGGVTGGSTADLATLRSASVALRAAATAAFTPEAMMALAFASFILSSGASSMDTGEEGEGEEGDEDDDEDVEGGAASGNHNGNDDDDDMAGGAADFAGAIGDAAIVV
ncbi:hypothetical protein BJ875DRAFT_438365 [Amylocarpus encephaloides]|uniref:Uncharacterized protein n=1 Tax=Amylocarpus encephaloides TaxID=45428 RepID=A0A9P7YQM9_9HELO|nr:hypothetical protein BJ875DRAFT_438365 [Amylocarpus encephaloides]